MGNLFTAGAEHIVAQSQIKANRIMQAGKNELSAAQSELQRFSAALSNKKAMDAAGKNINVTTENISRTLDAATTGRFSARVAAAEELGAMTAMNAAAGVGGSSVEAYNETLRLHAALSEEAGDRATNTQLIAQSAERGAILTDTVSSFDRNVYSADMDYRRWADHKKASIGGSLLAIGAGVAVGFATGNPQLGMSVAQAGLSATQGIDAAKNADFGTANQHFTSAIKSTVQAASSWQRAGSIKAETRIPDAPRYDSNYSFGSSDPMDLRFNPDPFARRSFGSVTFK